MAVNITYDGDTVEIENAMELLIAFDLAPTEADREILNQISGKITDLVRTDAEFLTILAKVLGGKEDSKVPYLKAFGDKLRGVVSDGDTASRALALIANEEDQKYFLESLGGEYLRKIINSLGEIAWCLEWLYGKMDTFFIELLGWEYIINYIKTGEGLAKILHNLSGEEETELLEKMGWKRVLECIRTAEDLYMVLTGMDSHNEDDLIENMTKEQLHRILPFKEQLNMVCDRYISRKDAEMIRKKYE